MYLLVLATYRSAKRNYQEGSTIEVTPDEAEFLKRDSPESFEEVSGSDQDEAPRPSRQATGKQNAAQKKAQDGAL